MYQMKKISNGCSVIEIGSYHVSMGIFQYVKGELKTLDQLFYPVTLGHEIFNDGRVSFSSLYELSAILQRFKAASEGFGIDNIHVVSTTVMREAGNSNLIADRILTQNKLLVRTLSDSEEKSLIYSDLLRRIGALPNKISNAVIAYVGSGSIGLAFFDGAHITRSYNIPLGSLKLRDILGSLRKGMSDYYVVVEEYLNSIFSGIEFGSCDCLILSGTEIEKIAEVCGAEQKNGLPYISVSSLKNFYKSIRSVTTENICTRLNIDEGRAAMFSTAMSIYYGMLGFVGKNAKIIAPSVKIEQVIANQAMVPAIHADYRKHVKESSLQAARILAAKFDCVREHSEAVRTIVCELFDKLKRLHGLDESYRNILEVAAILHSCGRYVNVKQRTRCSFDIIKNLDIYGMTAEEIRLVAFIAGYNEFNVPDGEDMNYRELSGQDRVLTAKLVALFRLANALDKSQKSKIQIDKIRIEEDVLVIRANASESAFLEQWAFDECAGFFREIYGIRPQLTIKTQLL